MLRYFFSDYPVVIDLHKEENFILAPNNGSDNQISRSSKKDNFYLIEGEICCANILYAKRYNRDYVITRKTVLQHCLTRCYDL